MTKNDAVRLWESSELPGLKLLEVNGPDLGRRGFAWDTYVDSLQKNGDITQHQYMTWVKPLSAGGSR